MSFTSEGQARYSRFILPMIRQMVKEGIANLRRNKEREEKKPTSPGPGICTMLVVGRPTKQPDGTPAVVGHVITIWWN